MSILYFNVLIQQVQTTIIVSTIKCTYTRRKANNNNSIHGYLRANLTAQMQITKLARERRRDNKQKLTENVK
jgi:hypothetical protein